MDIAPSVASSICAWCGRTIGAASPTALGSYGICLTCLGDSFGVPILEVSSVTPAVADTLPFGFIRLDSEGRVVAYNAYESALSGLPPQGVLGNNFFRTIAPCTCVEEFEGKLRKMMSSPHAERGYIEFLFKFDRRATMVDIAMTTDPFTGYATLLIRKMRQD